MRAVAGAARPIVLGRPAVLVPAHPAALVRMGVGVLGRSPMSNAVSHAQRAVEGNTAVVGRSRFPLPKLSTEVSVEHRRSAARTAPIEVKAGLVCCSASLCRAPATLRRGPTTG
jgi:hypothetical protein